MMKSCNKTHIEYVLPHTRFLLKWVPLVRKKILKIIQRTLKNAFPKKAPGMK